MAHFFIILLRWRFVGVRFGKLSIILYLCTHNHYKTYLSIK